MTKPEVELTGCDGNSMAIIAKCRKALRRSGRTQAEVERFTTEATSGDYDNVIQTAMKWCEVS